MERTDYRDVTRDLASALQMNDAYGVEFVEVDPIFELNTEVVYLPDKQQDARLQENLRVDRGRYLPEKDRKKSSRAFSNAMVLHDARNYPSVKTVETSTRFVTGQRAAARLRAGQSITGCFPARRGEQY